MFQPNTHCAIIRIGGKFNSTGEGVELPPINAKCAIVKLEVGVVKTSVRVDSSASRGNAWEGEAVARLLFLPNVEMTRGDRIEIHGYKLMVQSMFPRLHVSGAVDHWQVDCVSWPE
jgi:hypothetical protein